jgi:hypothetical protein
VWASVVGSSAMAYGGPQQIFPHDGHGTVSLGRPLEPSLHPSLDAFFMLLFTGAAAYVPAPTGMCCAEWSEALVCHGGLTLSLDICPLCFRTVAVSGRWA